MSTTLERALWGCVTAGAVSGWAALMAGLLPRRRFLLSALFVFFFSFTWKMVSTAYIDLAGPVESAQLKAFLGPGLAAGWLFLAYVVTLAPFLVLFSPAYVAEMRRKSLALGILGTGGRRMMNAAFLACAALVAALYIDMLRIGVIPLLEEMERYDYTADYAGVLHKMLIKYQGLVGLFLGSLFAYPALRGGRADVRFFMLAMAVFVYGVLTGHRFSFFLAVGSFFPVGLAFLADRREGSEPPVLIPRWVKAGAAGAVVLVAGAIGHSYFIVRSADQRQTPLAKLQERILVQQGELWWSTVERVFIRGDHDTDQAAYLLFKDPIDEKRNTTIQYLMWQNRGREAVKLIDTGRHQFGGGFPEIFFELGGPVGGWWMLALASAVIALALRETMTAFAEGRPVSFFCGAYLFYSLSICFFGGMLNFLVNLSFWMKVSALAGAVAVERSLARSGESPIKRLEAAIA